MKYLKTFESEVSSGNASGKAGTSSLPFARGFYQSGGCDGSPGINFTPGSEEPGFRTYKSMKHSRKNMIKKKKMKHIKKFETWTTDVTDNFTVNYGDKEPELSEVVKDIIKIIEDNYDKIIDTSTTQIRFKKDVLDFDNMSIVKNDETPYVNFSSYDFGGFNSGLTQDEYKLLYDIFKKIHIDRLAEKNQKSKEEYLLNRAKDAAKKYNL